MWPFVSVLQQVIKIWYICQQFSLLIDWCSTCHMHALAGSPWTANTQENVKALLIHLELKIVFFIKLTYEWANSLFSFWTVFKATKWLLCHIRMMSPMPCTVSTMMLCLLTLMKHRVIWSLSLYWKHSTWLGNFFALEISSRNFAELCSFLYFVLL